MREKLIQNQILRVFGTRPEMRLWRQNTGVARMGPGRVVRFGVPGQADLTGILPITVTHCCPHCGVRLAAPSTGARIEVEVKSSGGQQSPEQRCYQQVIERFGGLYIVARSVEDVRAAIDRFIHDRNPVLDQGAQDRPLLGMDRPPGC